MNEILIIGAGYSGMAATMGLARRVKGREDVQVTLVNPETRFTERLRLHQSASGQKLADLQIPDLLAGTGVGFVQGWVTAGRRHREGRGLVAGVTKRPYEGASKSRTWQPKSSTSTAAPASCSPVRVASLRR